MVQDVEKETHPRGMRDTRPLGHAIAALLSVLLHILPLPAYLLMGSISWFGDKPDELPDHETIIPIDLMFDEEGAGEPPAPIAPPAKPAHDDPAAPPVMLEGGAPAVADDSTDAGAIEDASTEEPAMAKDAGPSIADADIERDPSAEHDAGGASDAGIPSLDAAIASAENRDAEPDRTDAGFRPIRDPVASSGDVGKIAPKNPNVSLLIHPERIRGHKLAQQFAPTLTKLQNWRRFFDGTGVDPVQDADWILLAGPQLRDSSRVVAVLRYNVPQPRVRAAIDTLVRRSPGGQWVPKRVPVAKAHVDGAERYFVMPGPNILVVVPPDGLEQALKLPSNMSFPSRGNEAVVLYLKHPANAFRDQPVKLPTSVEWMRFSMTLNPAGGADARLDAKDQDAATAAKNAPELTEAINAAMVIDLIFTKQRLLSPVTFRAEGDHIRTETHVTDAQLKHLLSFLAAKIEQVDGARAPPPAGSR